MSSNWYLVNSAIRHQVLVQRRGGGLYNEVKPILVDLHDSIVARLSASPTDYQTARLQVLLYDIDGMISAATTKIGGHMKPETVNMAAYEVEAYHRMLSTANPNVDFVLPSIDQIASAAETVAAVTLVSGQTVKTMTIDDILAAFNSGLKKQVRSVINAGVIEGATTDQIVSRISMIAGGKARRDIQATAITVINAMADYSRQQVTAANTDLIAEERWVSTLDGRTSPICRSRDGNKYPADSGPRPPAHYRCRSVRVPVLNDSVNLPNLDSGATRSAQDGPVSSQTTYNSWLKKQSAEFQDEVLGPTRGALFRRGGLNMDSFVDTTGRTYTLDELRNLEPLAFQRANLQ